MDALINELKTRIIEALKLADLKPEDIDADAPLFGEGLGLDSIDSCWNLCCFWRRNIQASS